MEAPLIGDALPARLYASDDRVYVQRVSSKISLIVEADI